MVAIVHDEDSECILPTIYIQTQTIQPPNDARNVWRYERSDNSNRLRMNELSHPCQSNEPHFFFIVASRTLKMARSYQIWIYTYACNFNWEFIVLVCLK